jgi:hypothetical protein
MRAVTSMSLRHALSLSPLNAPMYRMSEHYESCACSCWLPGTRWATVCLCGTARGWEHQKMHFIWPAFNFQNASVDSNRVAVDVVARSWLCIDHGITVHIAREQWHAYWVIVLTRLLLHIPICQRRHHVFERDGDWLWPCASSGYSPIGIAMHSVSCPVISGTWDIIWTATSAHPKGRTCVLWLKRGERCVKKVSRLDR